MKWCTTHRTFAALSLLTLIALPGCSGSSSSGPAAHPATTLTPEQVNYNWSYTISGTAVQVPSGSAEPVSGTATASIIAANFNGATEALQLVSNVSINGGASTPITATYYFTQDANGNLIETGYSVTDSSGTTTRTVTSPSLANSEIFPGTFAQNEQISTDVNYTDNTSETYGFVVGSPVQKTTTAGTFNTWACTLTVGGALAGTEYWDPAIGMFVTGNLLTVADAGGQTYSFNIGYALTSTAGGVPAG